MPRIPRPVKINVDLGEAYGNSKCGPDDELIPLIDHANIACGGHAGDPLIMQETVRACKQHGIKIGAHPGLPDVQGFGRRAMVMQPDELTAMVRYQVGALKGFLDNEGVEMHHVKPHGALYGMMYKDRETCRAVYEGMPKGVKVFGLAGTLHEKAAREMGLPFVAELYGDVKYNKDRTLMIDGKKKQVVAVVSNVLFEIMLTSLHRPWTKDDLRRHITSQLENSSARPQPERTSTYRSVNMKFHFAVIATVQARWIL